MKYCHRCDSTKAKSDFNKSSAKKDGLQSCCRECSKGNNNSRYLTSPIRRSSVKRTRDKLYAYNHALLSRYKRKYKCLVCQESEPVVLDMHHLDPSVKVESASRLLSYSTKALKEEVSKCVILCSNCHRKVHAGLITLLPIISPQLP